MNNKARHLLRNYMALGAMAAMSNDPFLTDEKVVQRKRYEDLTDEEKQEVQENLKEKERKIQNNRGLKEFKYNGKSVFAINKKNADKKAKKKRLL